MSDLKVKAVFHAQVKAHSGKGTVTALVVGETGQGRLYGATNLVNAGLLDEVHHGRYVRADKLASLLGTKVVSGKDACRRFLSDNQIQGVSSDNILADALTPAGTVADKAVDEF